MLGIDVNDFREDARRFMRKYGLTYPVVYDGKGSTVGKWGVRGFPETFFVDRTGGSWGSGSRAPSTSSATVRPSSAASRSRSATRRDAHHSDRRDAS